MQIDICDDLVVMSFILAMKFPSEFTDGIVHGILSKLTDQYDVQDFMYRVEQMRLAFPEIGV